MNSSEFNILLIDDDQDDFFLIRDLFGDILHDRYKVTWKSNYTEGLKQLKENHFDACLLDYRLGEKTGIDLLREVQDLKINTPIILLTGQSDIDLDIKAMQTGAFEYLIKDQINSTTLERTIRYAMKHALDLNEITEQKELFKTLFNSTFEGIIVHKNLIIEDVNNSICEIFSLSRDEMIGKSLLDFIHNDFKDLSQKQLNSNESKSFEALGLKNKNEEITLEILNRKVKLSHHTLSIVAIRDISERKKLETQVLQQDRLASLGLLASSLAHEIGTPLGIIRSRTEMLEKKFKESEQLAQDLRSVIFQIDKITKLVHSLLNLAREKKSHFLQTTHLNQVVFDVLSLVQHELNRKNIKLITDIRSDFYIKADSGPLGQVLLNLLVNSTHAIDEEIKNGRINNHEISIKIEELDNKVIIFVSDSGCGIPEKNMSQIFKPFFTTKDVGSGTGLGLAISYKLIESWGGSIEVKNNIGHNGTCFKIALKKAAN